MKLALMGLLVALAAAAAAQSGKATELRFGNEPWHLVLSLGDLQPTQGFPSRADRQVITYRNHRGVMLSVVVENAHAPAMLASCRNVFSRRKQGSGGMVPVNELQTQRGEAMIQEYDLKVDSSSGTIVHHNIFSCRVRGNFYIDVHASKINYRPEDRSALIELVDSVFIVDSPHPRGGDHERAVIKL